MFRDFGKIYKIFFKKSIDSLLKVEYTISRQGGKIKMKREKLQEFRQSKHLTQEQMANRLDVTVSHYKALEYGQRNPSFELMEKIKNVFPKANIDKIFLS